MLNSLCNVYYYDQTNALIIKVSMQVTWS